MKNPIKTKYKALIIALYDKDLKLMTTSFTIKVIGFFFSFLLNVVLVRNIGTEYYGDYVYFLSIINFLSMMAIIGLDDTGLKVLTKYFSKKKYNNFNSFLKKCLKFVFFNSICISFLFFLFGLNFFNHLNVNKFYLFIICSFLITLNSITSIYYSALRAIEKMSVYLKLNIIARQIFLIVIVIVLKKVFKWNNVGVVEIYLSIIIFQILVIIFAQNYLKKNISLKNTLVDINESTSIPKLMSFYIFSIQSVNLLNTNLDNIFINYFIGAEGITYYALSSQIVLIIGFTLNAINVFLAPTISKLFFNGQKDDLQKKLKLIAKINIFSGIISFCFILLFGRSILNLYGISVFEPFRVVLILSIGSIIHLLCGSVTYLMIMTKIEKIAAILTGLSAIINLGFNIMLIPKYGIIGCAISTTISVIFYNVVSTFFILRKLDLDPTIFSLLRSK